MLAPADCCRKSGFSVTSPRDATSPFQRYRAAVLDPAQLVFAESMQLVLDEAAVAEEIRKNEREDRVAVVVYAIDFVPALSEVLLQVPKI
jgi:hypothetical protein